MAQAVSRRASTRPYHKGNVASDLMKAAAGMLDTGRVEDISVRALARAVGVTPGNFYNHFQSLEELLLNLAAEGFERRTAHAESIIAKAASRQDALLDIAIAYAEFAVDNKQLFRIMYGQVPNALAHDRFRRATDDAMSLISRLIYGSNRHDPDNPRLSHEQNTIAYAAAALASGLCRNLVEDLYEFRSGKRSEIRGFVRDVMSSFLNGSAAALLSEKADPGSKKAARVPERPEGKSQKSTSKRRP